MQCFYVLLHGRLAWNANATDRGQKAEQPVGLYCHRYVLASDREKAVQKAIDSASADLDNQTGWLRNRIIVLRWEAEEISNASFFKAFLPTNRGHTFYDKE